MSDTWNLFVSHIYEDDEHVEGLKKLLAKKDVAIRDSSITKDTPNNAKNENYIKSEILAPRIQWAGALVVIVTPDTKDSEYVDWEIRYAHSLGKRIIGVWAPGAANSDLPEALNELADAVVGWNGDSIIDAVNGADNWTSADGSTVAPREIPRHNC